MEEIRMRHEPFNEKIKARWDLNLHGLRHTPLKRAWRIVAGLLAAD
jgi:hypothetical protein